MCFDMMIKGNYNVNDLIDSNSLYLNIYIANSNNNNWPKLLGFVWIATLVLSGIAGPFKWIMQYKSLSLVPSPMFVDLLCLFVCFIFLPFSFLFYSVNLSGTVRHACVGYLCCEIKMVARQEIYEYDQII